MTEAKLITSRTSVPDSIPEFAGLRGVLSSAPVPDQICVGKPVLLLMDMSVYCFRGREDLVVAMIRCKLNMRDYNITHENQAGNVSVRFEAV